ncbi:MAG: TerC family protein [Alphaproteobacteria bacterium]|nr:TerC family protein [Alphaproteobacteria bacterium]
MLELFLDPAAWASLATLTLLEIVLGIDNIVFISVLVSRLPPDVAKQARQIGLALALVFRIILLLLISWIIGLTAPIAELFGHAVSWRDLILIAGGAFLIYKATAEIHHAIEEPHEQELARNAPKAFSSVIVQVVLLDMVFSIDSIITAVGMAQHLEIMITAVVIAMALMYFASASIAGFIGRHPTTKMLALAFLLLIGVTLVADGLGVHVPKGYIYSAMAFAVLVEAFNIFAQSKRKQKREQA